MLILKDTHLSYGASQKEVEEERALSEAKYEGFADSCVVELPTNMDVGDKLTIRWPTMEQSKHTEKRSQRKTNRTASSHKELLVKVVISRKLLSSKVNRGSRQYMKVYAPWLSAKRANNNILHKRQLRSIGVSTRQKVRAESKGLYPKHSSRIGDSYQVSMEYLTSFKTWTTSTSPSASVAHYEQIWDKLQSGEARINGEKLDDYIESLEPFQRARGMMTLHQESYKTSTSKKRFHHDTVAIIPYPSDPPGLQKPNSLLEGSPLSQREQTAFREALKLHGKFRFSLIAQAVGTSVNRCLVHYYRFFKLCIVCHNGGDLVCCDGMEGSCLNSYHKHCLKPPLTTFPDPNEDWFCPDCCQKKRGI